MAARLSEQAVGEGTPKKPKKPRKKFKKSKLFLWLFFTAAFAVFCGIAGYLVILLNGERILTEQKDKFDMAESSILKDADGKEVLRFGPENREYITYDKIPKLLVQAVIATEDKRFYEHQGVDFWSIGRALVKDVVQRSAVEGGSTITQQLAKNLFLSADKTFFRKATEASIAVALETKRSKDEIMELYLNRIYYGKGAYGVQAASKYYFNKPVDKLDLWQIATLAGIPKAPSTYNPISNPEKSKERRGVVLQLMYEQGIITAQEKEKAAAEEYKPPVRNTNSEFLAYKDYVIEEAMKLTKLSEDELLRGGYIITTTMNQKAQRAMASVFADDKMFEEDGPDQKQQASMVIVDQSNGGIVAMVGGRDYIQKGFNRAVAPRQPGSSFKPIAVYAPAIESGNWSPYSTLRDDKQCFGKYCPSDHGRNKYVGPISMMDAVKRSVNLPAVWLLDQIGMKTGYNFAKSLGIPLTDEDKNLAIALGGLTKGASPLNMAQAYSAFANGGRMYEAHAITEITTTEGDPVYSTGKLKAEQVMSEQTAFSMTQLLEGVLTPGGTGVRAKIDRPVAGKTGTTQVGIKGVPTSGNRDIWFVGYTPEWTGAVWMGFDKTDKDHYLKKGSGQAAQLWGEVMSKALAGRKVVDFKKPEGVVEVTEPPSGVSDLKATVDTETESVDLIWKASPDKATYRLYRKEASEAQFSMLQEIATGTEVVDMSTVAGKTYQYYVTAYFAESNLESEKSNVVTVVMPDAINKEPDILPPDEQPMEEEPPIDEILPPNDSNGQNGNGNGNGKGKGNHGNGNGNKGNSDNGGTGDTGNSGIDTGIGTDTGNGTDTGDGTGYTTDGSEVGTNSTNPTSNTNSSGTR